MKRGFACCCLWVMLVAGGGCRGGAAIPDGWVADPQLGGSSVWQASAMAQRDRAPRLQVMIHYSRTHSTHTTLRVTHPGEPAVFWDPGGNYGKTKASYGRQNDVILDAPPDLPTWWAYRQRWLREPFLTIFEWDLAPQQSRAMRDALLDGALRGNDDPVFYTLRRPGLCNFAVCEFLRRFGPPHISPQLRDNFLPDSLAKQLWKQKPDRVLRYEGPVDALPTVWLPPAE